MCKIIIRLSKCKLTPFETKLIKYANNGDILLEVCMSLRAHCNNSTMILMIYQFNHNIASGHEFVSCKHVLFPDYISNLKDSLVK